MFKSINYITVKLKSDLLNFRIFIFIFILLGVYKLIQWPIAALDTDLWYHLSHGRFIIEHKKIPDSTYFSFISPAREWIDYYWLFQVLVFKIYSWANYHGLVIFRAFMILATVLVIYFYLFHHQQRESFFYFTLIFCFLFLILLPRFQLIRPHSFSYSFIPLFIYILEYQPRKTFLLPILTILWCNLHGIQYPVILLICLAYSTEFIFWGLVKKNFDREKIFSFLSLIFSAGFIYLTPHGFKLLHLPLISIEYASQYINELRPIELSNLFYFHLTSLHPTIFNLLFFLILLKAIFLVINKQIRISWLIMLAGGLFLLTKGTRFKYEFLLLSLPLLSAHPYKIYLSRLSEVKKYLAFCLLALISFLPTLGLIKFFENFPKFPLSYIDLPQGITTFLNKIPAHGSLLNHPNNGGYFQWMLYPRYKIFMDMEVPFVFRDEDFFMAANAFSDEEVLRKIILKYEPAFISVPIRHKEFSEIIKKFPEYNLVFFDSAEVLFLNQKHFPHLAEKHKLRINPFELLGKPIDAIINHKGREILISDLTYLLEIYPECMITNQIMAMLYNKERQYQKAIIHADRLIYNYPDIPMGYKQKGIALKGLNSFDQALSFLNKALERTKDDEKRTIFKEMAYIHIQKQEYFKAYNLFKKAIRVYAIETTYQELFDLSSAAILASKIEDAIFLLRLAAEKVPPEDKKYKERIESQLYRLGISKNE